MTQAFRCLTALTLLLAFSAGAVRADEKQTSPRDACRRQCCAPCACSGKCCEPDAPADAIQYVVSTKIVTANAEGDCDELISPKVTMFEGQGAEVLLQGIQTPTQSRALTLQMQVTKQGKDVRLALGVENQMSCGVGALGQCAWTEGTRKVCNVTLGKMKRLVLQKNADGSDRTWAEVTVTAIAPEEDAEGWVLDCVGDVVDDLIETAADVATSLFGDDAKAETAEEAEYPIPAMAPCPSACKRCVAVEAVKKAVVLIHIDAKDNRACLEMREGKKSWKASARQISVANGALVLDGDVHCEGNDGSPFCQTDKMLVQLPDGIDIKVGD